MKSKTINFYSCVEPFESEKISPFVRGLRSKNISVIVDKKKDNSVCLSSALISKGLYQSCRYHFTSRK